jgi:hypothetical protein
VPSDPEETGHNANSEAMCGIGHPHCPEAHPPAPRARVVRPGRNRVSRRARTAAVRSGPVRGDLGEEKVPVVDGDVRVDATVGLTGLTGLTGLDEPGQSVGRASTDSWSTGSAPRVRAAAFTARSAAAASTTRSKKTVISSRRAPDPTPPRAASGLGRRPLRILRDHGGPRRQDPDGRQSLRRGPLHRRPAVRHRRQRRLR